MFYWCNCKNLCILYFNGNAFRLYTFHNRHFLFLWKWICMFFLLFRYTCICIVVGDTIIKKKGWGPIKLFNLATRLCLSQARTWISNVICRGIFTFKDLRWEGVVLFFHIGGNIDHRYLSCLLIYVTLSWINV